MVCNNKLEKLTGIEKTGSKIATHVPRKGEKKREFVVSIAKISFKSTKFSFFFHTP